MLMLLISQLMIWSRTLPSFRRSLLTTSTIQELLRDHLLMTPLIGLDLRAIFVLLMLTTPRLLVPSMLKDTGESSSNTSQRDMDTVTITIPKPLVLRPVFPRLCLSSPCPLLPVQVHPEVCLPQNALCGPLDPYRGFFIDTYKLPSACSCHLPA